MTRLASATEAAHAGLQIRRLGEIAYRDAFELQEELRNRHLAGRGRDTVLLLEHPDVITFGRGAGAGTALLSEAGLRAQGYDVHRVNRGGDVTYHGPGQLVGYPILDLKRHGRDVHLYLRTLEQALIACLARFEIAALCRPGFAGVWLDERHKIASIGVGVRRWVTLHGFALNVNCDLSRFAPIIPCGLEGVEMVSMESVIGVEVALEPVLRATAEELEKVFA